MTPPPVTPLSQSKTVFVANIPYDVTEEQLATIFSEVGPVAGFDLKFDTNTGRAKGYGFCHYYDHETALSAVRNLQKVSVSGRTLRVELPTGEPITRKRIDGRPSDRGGGGGGGGVRSTPAGLPPGAGGGGRYMDYREGPPPPMASGIDLGALPPGQAVAPGVKATDQITKTLAGIPPGKLEEVLMQMKTLVQASPDHARTVLGAHPQLAYALFQAMLLVNVVEPYILGRIQPLPNPSAPKPAPYPSQPTYPPAPSAPGYGALPPRSYPPAPAPAYPSYSAPAPPPPQQVQYPPQQEVYHPPQAGYGALNPPAGYRTPPQPQQASGQPNIAALAQVSEDQRAMLMQVLSLTNDQVNALPADQRASVVQLRTQFSFL